MAQPLFPGLGVGQAAGGAAFEGGPRIGGPAANPWANLGAGGVGPVAGGIINSGMGGWAKPQPAPVPQGEPPWVTKAREARKRAKAGAGAATPPPTSGPGESMPAPAPAETAPPIPPPTGPYNPGPQPTNPGVPPPNMGGIPRGGIMGGYGLPKQPQAPKLQRIPGPGAPSPRDTDSVYGKTPGGGF